MLSLLALGVLGFALGYGTTTLFLMYIVGLK